MTGRAAGSGRQLPVVPAGVVYVTERAAWQLAPLLEHPDVRRYVAARPEPMRSELVDVIEALQVVARSFAARRAAAIGNAEADPAETVRRSTHEDDEIGTAEVAAMLDLSERRVRQLGVELGGRLVGRAWLFSRAVIAEVRDHRGSVA